MPKISEEQREARREQILAAAWRCFLRSGIHGTSMEEIIREAQLSAGAVYLYYKGKDDLILAAISTYMANLRALLVPLLTADEPLPPLEFAHKTTAILAKFTRRQGTNLSSVIVMCWSEAQTNAQVKKLIRDFQISYLAALTRLVKVWQQRGDLAKSSHAEDVARATLSFFLGFITQSALIGQVSANTIARGLKGLLSPPL